MTRYKFGLLFGLAIAALASSSRPAWAQAAASTTALETFLGIPPGSISTLIGGSPIEGSGIKQTITVNAGDTLSFRHNFMTDEFTPDNTYNDTVFFTVVGPGATVVKVADTFDTPFSLMGGAAPPFFEMLGYRTFTHTFTAAGSVTIGIAIIDKGDGIVDSGVLIDSLVMVPANATLVNPAFDTGSFAPWQSIGATTVIGPFGGIAPETASYQALLTTEQTPSFPTAGVTVTQSGGSTAVSEGGPTDTYTVVLNTAPTANVTITINPGTQVTVAPATLTFTPANWNTAQTVTVTAVDDAAVEGAHTGTITHTSASTDSAYNGIAIASVTANITDNDAVAGAVTVTQSGGTTLVTEGGVTDTYTVVLNSAPTANVTITISPDTQVAVAPATLTFTPANWNTAQTVTVTAVDDAAVEGAHTGSITHTSASTDATFNAIAITSVTANITDNDSPAAVTVTQSGGTTLVTEGGVTDTYTIVLNSAPTANVTITVSPGAQVMAAPATLTFTPANWSAPQTVTVTAVDDTAAEGTHTATITHSAASTDATYNGVAIAGVTVTITDNDVGAEGTFGGPSGPPGPEGSFAGARKVRGGVTLVGPFLQRTVADSDAIHLRRVSQPPWHGAELTVFNVSHQPAAQSAVAQSEPAGGGTTIGAGLALLTLGAGLLLLLKWWYA